MVLLPLGHIKKLGPGLAGVYLAGAVAFRNKGKIPGPKGFDWWKTKETADSTGHVVSF
jgi:hypothetical protein